MQSPEQRAKELFDSGWYCAESVLKAIAERLDINSEFIPGMATGFCGGMSRCNGPCGALTGGVMAIGMVHGRRSEKDDQRCYIFSSKLIQRFVNEFGSMNCTEIIGKNLGIPAQRQEALDGKIIAGKCPGVTGTAARLTWEILEEAREMIESGKLD